MIRLLLCLILGTALMSNAAEPDTSPAYMDLESAANAHADSPMVGEYVSKDGKNALQANLLSDGTFLVAQYAGGLPGDGWDRSAIDSSVKTTVELMTTLSDYKKVNRESPTLGKPAPENAIIKFPKDVTNVKDGIMMAGGQTIGDLGSFKMHLEFMLPFKPGNNPSSQKRGNSGIYIFNNYEIQIIDTFGLDYENPENNAIKAESLNTQWCAALYKMKLPDLNMTFPPLQWQTYDIEFQAPEFDGDKKVKNARLTLYHNGVKIHDDVELPTGTGNGAKKPQVTSGPVFFQNHNNPVMYRNVWATEL